MDNITKLEFFKNAYAAVIDFRTTAQWDIAASGLQLESSQAGIVLRIKRASAANLRTHIFTFSNSVIGIVGNTLEQYEN